MIKFGTTYNNPVLSNNNQTITCNQGAGSALLDTIVSKNKLYLEINLSTFGIAPYIGIVNSDNYVYIYYPPYNNSLNVITSQYGGRPSDTKPIPSTGILSILIDCIDKHIKILYNNSTILIDKDFTFDSVNVIMGSGDSGGGEVEQGLL